VDGVGVHDAPCAAVVSHAKYVLDFFNGQLLLLVGVLQSLQDFGF